MLGRPMLRPRRPLLGAAMVGGAYAAGRGRANAQTREREQEERLAALESEPVPGAYQQPIPQPGAYQAQAVPAPAPAVNTAGPATDVAAKLTQLKSLLDQGVLTPEEFNLAKQRVLAG